MSPALIPALAEKHSSIVWFDSPRHFTRWGETERADVEEFLRAHDIEPRDVQIGGGNEMAVWLLPSGVMELSVWVADLDNGAMVRCPTCPACVRQKLVTREVTMPLPMTSTSWVAKPVTVNDDEGENT